MVCHTIPSPAPQAPRAKYLRQPEGAGIRTKNGFIPLHVLRPLDAEGDDWRLCVLTERCEGYPEGTLFLYDRRLWKEERLTHKAYVHGLYSLLRGILYTLVWYGVGAPAQAGEFGHLKEDEKVILRCAKRLLSGMLSRDGEDEATVLAAVQAIQNGLTGATDHAKQRAHANAGRGMRLTDARDRRNIPAATLSLGGVACQLQKRARRVVQVAKVYRGHARTTSQWLDRHLVPILRLRGAVQRNADPQKWGFLQKVDINTLGDNRLAINQRLIQELQELFRSITPIAPFHKHWAEIQSDLADAENAAARDDGSKLTQIKTRLRRRTEWILLRNALELDVNARLGMLLRRLEREMQDKLRREFPCVPIGVHDLRFHQDQAPDEFAEVTLRFQFLRDNVVSASDRGFPVKFREEVLTLLERVNVHMRREEWRTAREVLKETLALI